VNIEHAAPEGALLQSLVSDHSSGPGLRKNTLRRWRLSVLAKTRMGISKTHNWEHPA
jgi:hypothetical protein